MDEPNTIRKLRAIMFSDIVGYTKMMQNNESESLKLLQKHKDIVTEISAKYGGKIIKHIGDEILVESESAVMLVYCAKELQKYFADRNATVPKSRELSVRIGIHIGDVIVKDDDIFGDGVNIASRIRPLAQPGSIVITHSVLILLGNQDDIKCELIGNKRLKNIKEKVKVYEVLTGSEKGTLRAGKSTGKSMDMDTLLKFVLPVFGSVLFLILLLFLFFFDHFTDFEEHFLRSEFSAAREITKDLKSEKNIKSNYFNIMSAGTEEGREIHSYYSGMYSKDPDDPKKALYLAMSYFRFYSDRNQLDSSYILLKKASNSGLKSLYLNLMSIDLFSDLNIKTACEETAARLAEEYPDDPLSCVKCGDVYRAVLNDNGKAAERYRRAIDIYPETAAAYNGLAQIEFSLSNIERARSLSDSALMINSEAQTSAVTAIEIRKSLSDFSGAREILNKLPDNSIRKYTESANISLLENDPSAALGHINSGLEVFPNRTELAKMQKDIQKMILISDSIQQKETSISRTKSKMYDSWTEASQVSLREQKPLIVAALDGQELRSKYIEHALLHKDVIRESGDVILLRLFRHKDAALLRSLGVNVFPSLVWADQNKEEIKSFKNILGNVTDAGVIASFIKESSLLNKRMVSMIRETETNKVKNARNFSHAEELALEYEMPIILVMSDSRSQDSQNYLKHTIFNPAFMKNYRNMIFLSVEDAERSELPKKFEIKSFPAVLFFDEDINLISVKYGVLPQKVLEKEISKIKLFRKRRDILKEEINWIYNTKEAVSYSSTLSKPVLAYLCDPSAYGFIPEENIFSDYNMIKKINSDYIPLFIRKDSEGYNQFFKDIDAPRLAVMNSFGDVLYDFHVPSDKEMFGSFLDIRTMSDLYIGLGSGEFGNFIKNYETYRSLMANRMKISAEGEILSFVTNYPSFPYSMIDLAELFLTKNDFLKSGHYLRFLKDKNFNISEKFLQILISSYILYDDIFRLNEFMSIIDDKTKKDSSGSSSVISARAEISLAESETIPSISFAEKAYQIDPKRKENLTLLGILNYSLNVSKSEDYFKSALILDPDDLVSNLYLYKITGRENYLTSARKSYHSGNDDFTGLRYFQESKFFSNPGIVELKERAYRMKLILYPENTEFLLDLARFLTDSKRNLIEALDITGKLLAESPNDPEYLSAAAWAFYHLGNFSEADKLITKSLGNLSPDEYHKYPELFYNTGMIKSAIGDNRTAKYYFEMLLSFRNMNDIDYSKIDYAERFVDSIQ
ncbi:MAG: adenylate/guanylate cyclase domain-containing protein [Candidatus Delongbacteria bacterium]|nr:adenylate/guanylate cyclase domain-containing protein [Candidatus Delongbacteria bacterium]